MGYLVLSFITLISLMFGAGAAPATQVGTEYAAPAMLDDIAAEIAEDVGVVTTVVETDTEPTIFVFEERHDSMLGQVEIAIMLNRLYADYDLRHIGLEGVSTEQGNLDLSWAHREPYYEAGQPIAGREDVMVQTLQEGEISSAELIGLVYHDVVVHGIDDTELYAFELTPEMSITPFVYLYYIALAGMDETDNGIWQALYTAEKYTEAFDFAMGTNEFAGQMNERLSDPVNIVSSEDWLVALDEIQAEAEASNAGYTENDAANIAAMGEFLETSSQRSDAMVTAMLELTDDFPDAPIAMTIGAMHTARVQELLGESDVSFVVIRSVSLAEDIAAGRLSSEAWMRKQQGLSVSPDGTIGALLDGRGKKPGPVADKERYKTEQLLREVLQAQTEYAHSLLVLDMTEEEILKEVKQKFEWLKEHFDFPDNFPDIQVLGVTVGTERENIWVKWQITVNGRATVFETYQHAKFSKEESKEEYLQDFERRLNNAREELLSQETPTTETQPGEKPSGTPICSTTSVVMLTEAGG